MNEYKMGLIKFIMIYMFVTFQGAMVPAPGAQVPQSVNEYKMSFIKFIMIYRFVTYNFFTTLNSYGKKSDSDDTLGGFTRGRAAAGAYPTARSNSDDTLGAFAVEGAAAGTFPTARSGSDDTLGGYGVERAAAGVYPTARSKKPWPEGPAAGGPQTLCAGAAGRGPRWSPPPDPSWPGSGEGPKRRPTTRSAADSDGL